MLLEKQSAKRGVGYGIERIDVELFSISGRGFVEFLLLLKSEAEIVVGVFVERIYVKLLVKGNFGLVKLAQAQMREAQIVVTLLGFGIELHGAFKKWNCVTGIS